MLLPRYGYDYAILSTMGTSYGEEAPKVYMQAQDSQPKQHVNGSNRIFRIRMISGTPDIVQRPQGMRSRDSSLSADLTFDRVGYALWIQNLVKPI